jgi:hypothetical protein
MPDFTQVQDKAVGGASGGSGGGGAGGGASSLCPSMDLLAYSTGDSVHVVVRGRGSGRRRGQGAGVARAGGTEQPGLPAPAVRGAACRLQLGTRAD